MHRTIPASVAAAILLIVPTASAVEVNGVAIVEGDLDGQVVMACSGPGFINCSIAMAAAFGVCKTFKYIGEICIGGGAGAIGGISSLAISGGGAAGDVNDVIVGCVWNSGTSGGCIDIEGDFGFDCIEIAATGNGYLAVPVVANNNPIVGAIIGLNGPTVTANAVPDCALLRTITNRGSMPADAPTPLEVEQALQAELIRAIEDLELVRIVPNDAPAALDDMEAALRMELANQAMNLHVEDDYNIVLPSSF